MNLYEVPLGVQAAAWKAMQHGATVHVQVGWVGWIVEVLVPATVLVYHPLAEDTVALVLAGFTSTQDSSLWSWSAVSGLKSFSIRTRSL